MKQLWLWLGAVALGVGLLGLVIGSVFDLTGQTVSSEPKCLDDSTYSLGGKLMHCDLGERCVPDKGLCASMGKYACLDEKNIVFVPQAGSPADFSVELCQFDSVCMAEPTWGATCVQQTALDRNPTMYLDYVW